MDVGFESFWRVNWVSFAETAGISHLLQLVPPAYVHVLQHQSVTNLPERFYFATWILGFEMIQEIKQKQLL